LSADGRFAAALGENSCLHGWPLPTNGEPTSTIQLKQPPRSIALSPDGGRLAYMAADHRLRVVKVDGGQETAIRELPGLTGRCLHFTPDGRRLLVGGEDHCVRVFDIAE